MVYNCINIIAWVTLACFFGKWWLVLFSGLTLLIYKNENNKDHYRVCDGCGRYSPVASSHNDAIDMAEKAGWYCTIVHLPDGTTKAYDYCPECQKGGKCRR